MAVDRFNGFLMHDLNFNMWRDGNASRIRKIKMHTNLLHAHVCHSNITSEILYGPSPLALRAVLIWCPPLR